MLILTGTGKPWQARTLAQQACRHGYSAINRLVPRLMEELSIWRGSGVFKKWMLQVAKTDVFVLDDWGVVSTDGTTRSDLLDSIDHRAGNKANIITIQLPVVHWHAWIGDATIAETNLDGAMQRKHGFTLTGDLLRMQKPKTASMPPS